MLYILNSSIFPTSRMLETFHKRNSIFFNLFLNFPYDLSIQLYHYDNSFKKEGTTIFQLHLIKAELTTSSSRAHWPDASVIYYPGEIVMRRYSWNPRDILWFTWLNDVGVFSYFNLSVIPRVVDPDSSGTSPCPNLCVIEKNTKQCLLRMILYVLSHEVCLHLMIRISDLQASLEGYEKEPEWLPWFYVFAL